MQLPRYQGSALWHGHGTDPHQFAGTPRPLVAAELAVPPAKLSASINISKPAPPSGEHIPCSVRAVCTTNSCQLCRRLDCSCLWRSSPSSCSSNRFSPIFTGSSVPLLCEQIQLVRR